MKKILLLLVAVGLVAAALTAATKLRHSDDDSLSQHIAA
jgi:hypothetical protein